MTGNARKQRWVGTLVACTLATCSTLGWSGEPVGTAGASANESAAAAVKDRGHAAPDQHSSAAAVHLVHSFTGGKADGAYPTAGLIADAKGNLYGTTYSGGASGKGVVFRIAADGTETILHSFAGGNADGAHPSAGLVMDHAGNLYGTTYSGGASRKGIVFKLEPDGTEIVLHAFAGGAADGAFPSAGLLRDSAGNLYGTTQAGGTTDNGTVFKIATDGNTSILHSFASDTAEGVGPSAGLTMGRAGGLYGTTYSGGTSDKGAVFRIN